MSDFTCQLGPVSFTVMPGGDFGQVLQALDFGSTARADVPRLAVLRSDVPRTFSFPALIEAATKDEAIAVISAANKALSVSNTLIVHSKDAGQSVTFRTFPSGSVHQAPLVEWEQHNKQAVQVTVTVEPYAYGDLVTDAHSISAPDAIDLEDMPGEYTAPLAVELEIVTAGDKLHACYLALNEHPEWNGWIVEAHPLTWEHSGGVVADSGVAYGGSYVKTTSTTRMHTALETSAVPPGDYLVLVRAKTSNTADTGTIDIASATRWTATIPTGANKWRYYEVGDLALPYSLTRGTAGSTMEIGVTSGSGSYFVEVDTIVLLPYRAGFQSWHPPNANDSASYWYEGCFFDSDGAVYLDDVCHLEDATGAPVKSLAGELIVLCDEKDGDTDHTHLTVTLTQIPRYSLYR